MHSAVYFTVSARHTPVGLGMVAHKCQISSKDRAHHTDTITTPHDFSKCSVVSLSPREK